MASEALNAGQVYSEIVLKMEKFDAAMVTLQSALKKIDEDIEKTKKKFDLTAAAEKMKKAGTMMSLAFTAPLTIMGGLSISAASDLEESANKAKVVFGDAIGVIDDLAKTSAVNLGMSKQAAYESAGTFGNLFVAMGITQNKAAGMSSGILKLAADLASFNNIKPEEALEKLRAGLVGEAEPLRTLGVNLTAVSVEAKAMSLAHKASAAQLTTADKAMASYALILEQTQTAQGDFARTSDGLANSQRTLKAQTADQSAEIGGTLLPYYSELLNMVGQLVTWFAGLDDGTKSVIVTVAAMVATIGPLLLVGAKLITSIRTISSVFKGMELAAKAADIAAKIFSSTARTITLSAGGLIGVLSVVVGLLMTSRAEAAELDDVMNSTEGMKQAAEAKEKLMKQYKTLSDNGRNLISTFELIGDANKIDIARTQSLTGELGKLEGQYRSLGSKKQEIINNGYYEGQDKDLQKLSEERRAIETKIGLIKAAQAEVLKLAKSQAAEGSGKTPIKPIVFTPPESGAGKVAKNEAEEFKKAWKSALDTTSSDFSTKITAITDFEAKFGESSQATAMKFAAVFTSAFASISNLFSAMIQAQQTEIENKYSTLSAAEQEYVNYQDAEDAKAYSKMTAKEKKEHDLKAASDRAEKKREAEKAAALKKLQKEQARLNLINALATIGVGTAMGIMNIWANPGNSSFLETYRFGLTAFVAGLGLTEAAAAITAAAPAMATGGLVKSKSGGVQITAAEAGNDEWVVPDTEVVMRGIASRLGKILSPAKDESASRDSAVASEGSFAERFVARVVQPFILNDIVVGNSITDIFEKGYARVGSNRVVPA